MASCSAAEIRYKDFHVKEIKKKSEVSSFLMSDL